RLRSRPVRRLRRPGRVPGWPGLLAGRIGVRPVRMCFGGEPERCRVDRQWLWLSCGRRARAGYAMVGRSPRAVGRNAKAATSSPTDLTYSSQLATTSRHRARRRPKRFTQLTRLAPKRVREAKLEPDVPPIVHARTGT